MSVTVTANTHHNILCLIIAIYIIYLPYMNYLNSYIYEFMLVILCNLDYIYLLYIAHKFFT